MTMFSVRVDDEEAIEIQQWQEQPLTVGEVAISQIADWGVAEDWSDWADATR